MLLIVLCVLLLMLFLMSKAMARSGVIRVCDKGMSSSGEGSCSSHLENQFESSSLIVMSGEKD
jgi:hypothetical protein